MIATVCRSSAAGSASGVVVHPRGHLFTASSIDDDPRDMTTAPVRTSSLMPYGAHQRDERVDLVLGPGDLDDHGLGREVRRPAPSRARRA
jgi:hypothetical protein